MKVKFVNWKLQYRKYKKEIDKAVKSCFRRGNFIMRSDVKEFEQNIASYLNVKYAIGLNSGTDALFLSLKALGIGKGNEVITTSWGFIATIAAIAQTGADPILIDINEKYVMDANLLESAITKNTRAIIPVHLNGVMCDMNRILNIGSHYNIPIIEDAAQAFSQEYNGKKAGSMGLAGCFSFYPSKMVGAAGDAGALVTNNEGFYRKIRLLQDHGRKTKTETTILGWNSRLDNIQAAILNVKFRHLEETKAKRLEAIKVYQAGIQDIPQIKFMLHDEAENFVVEVDRRDELFNFLANNKIETQIHEPWPYHWIETLGLRFFVLPCTENLSKKVITLPLNAEITQKEQEYILTKLHEFYR